MVAGGRIYFKVTARVAFVLARFSWRTTRIDEFRLDPWPARESSVAGCWHWAAAVLGMVGVSACAPEDEGAGTRDNPFPYSEERTARLRTRM